VRSPVTGKGWEGVGVPPEVRVASADALRTAHKRAVTQELVSEPDPRRRAALQRLLAEM